MALFRYFKRDSAGTFLPDSKGPLSTSLSTGTIKAANKAVLCDGHGQKAHVCFRNYQFRKFILKPIPLFFENLHFESFPLYGSMKYIQNTVSICKINHYDYYDAAIKPRIIG